jgi:D-psicose/D-tagatose/L-ribulose 3-epimerase|tara:strand:- start:5119 stop:5961 length:843 start_codon:yes stop_codon:yes gene_type:complete
MKIGMNLYLWLTKLEPQHFELLAKLKHLGFDGVEIPTGDYTTKELANIRNALNNEDLKCTVATLLSPEVNPISPDSAIRAAARDKLQHDINIASELGSEALIGPMHSGHKLFYDRGPNQQEVDLCTEFLAAMGTEAKQANLLLGVEPLNRFECYFLNTAAQGKQLVDAVNLDNVGILYDTHHANIEEYNVYDAITGLGNRLNHFHISESHRGSPGTGAVDWRNSFKALKDMNYKGWLVIESFAKDVEGFPEAVNIWRDCFNSKDEVVAKGLALIQHQLAN